MFQQVVEAVIRSPPGSIVTTTCTGKTGSSGLASQNVTCMHLVGSYNCLANGVSSDEFPMNALQEAVNPQALRALDHAENIAQGESPLVCFSGILLTVYRT